MAVETDADRLAFFDTDEFGVSATVGGNSLDGIFDNEYISALDMTGTQPVFLCRSSDAALYSITRGSVLVINGTSYTVQNSEPDGTGITKLVLSD